MVFTQPSAEIMFKPIDTKAILKRLETIGRTCYASLDKMTETSASDFVRGLVKRQHEAILEHATITVKFIVDRGISHEIVRHRVASYAQESTRYCNYNNDKFGNEITVIDIKGGIKLDKAMCENVSEENIVEIVKEWENAMNDAQEHYLTMIKLGATPQIARSVLPNSTKTEITITANYREWRNFFKLRVPQTAHPQMREITIPLLKELKEKLPEIFFDIELPQ